MTAKTARWAALLTVLALLVPVTSAAGAAGSLPPLESLIIDPDVAAAVPAPDWLPALGLPERHGAQVSATLAHGDRVREALGSGSVAAAVREALPAAAHAPRAEQLDPPAVLAADLALVAGLPAPLRRPLAELNAGVRWATTGLRTLIPVGGTDPAGAALGVLFPAAAAASGGRILAASPTPSPAMAAQLREIAVVLGAAVDRALPALQRHGATVRPTILTAGCDVLDVAGVICVASAEDNVLTSDAPLVVDLGGDDVHRHSAGGASFDRLPVAVTVDVDGHDRYESRPGAGPALQGAAYGGIGVLVDLAGDDSYEIRADDVPLQQLGAIVAVGQGGALGGAGVLVDWSGADVRQWLPPASPHVVAAFVGQGGAAGTMLSVEGAFVPMPAGAVLVDLGGSADRYEVDLGQSSNARQAVAQGAGFSVATGLLFDGGGVDRFSVAGTLEVPEQPPFHLYHFAYVQALAFVDGARGMLLSGEGDTTYVVDLTVRGFGAADVRAQASAGAGTALLEDLGGDDRYEVRVDLAHRAEHVVDDECRCEATVAIEMTPDLYISRTSVDAQGSGVAGVAVLRDRSGDDTYVAEQHAALDLTLRDERSTAPHPARLAVTNYMMWQEAQGAGSLGTGVLVDEAGDDSYRFVADSEARATTISAGGNGSAAVLASPTYLLGQGAASVGSGALADLDGTADVVAQSVHEVLTGPDPRGGFISSVLTAEPIVQGAAYTGGTATLVARGVQAAVLSRPSLPACQGVRGFGHWLDCPRPGAPSDASRSTAGVAAGSAAAATGQAPVLAFVEPAQRPAPVARVDTLVPGYPRIPVAVELHDAEGRPMPGQAVDLYLQTPDGHSDEAATTWDSLWRVSAVTDDEGVARAEMPGAWGEDAHPGYATDHPPESFRLFASFSGAHGVQPAHAAQPLP